MGELFRRVLRPLPAVNMGEHLLLHMLHTQLIKKKPCAYILPGHYGLRHVWQTPMSNLLRIFRCEFRHAFIVFYFISYE